MLIVCLHNLRQADEFIMITFIRILFRNGQPDSILWTVVDTGHAYLAVFSRIHSFLILHTDTAPGTDSGTDPAADTIPGHLIKIFPEFFRF